MSR
ncbi:hypothetical protein VCNEP21106_003437A, partial [Vibrio cholerae O1 str. Nep-21106]|jgi:hypothetical protein